MSSLNPTTESQSVTSQQAFVDRRTNSGSAPQVERRQFSSSYSELTPAGAELGVAVDQYKMNNRRRFVTYDEILDIVKSLGYTRPDYMG